VILDMKAVVRDLELDAVEELLEGGHSSRPYASPAFPRPVSPI
jgi:hypothetical protein